MRVFRTTWSFMQMLHCGTIFWSNYAVCIAALLSPRDHAAPWTGIGTIHGVGGMTGASRLSVCVFTRTWLSSGAGLFAQELVASMLNAGAAVTFVAPRAEDPRFEAPRAG
jgi:hypothetical protein